MALETVDLRFGRLNNADSVLLKTSTWFFKNIFSKPSGIGETQYDGRSLGEFFLLMTAEFAVMSFNHALQIIVIAMVETVKEYFKINDNQIDEFVTMFINKHPPHIQKALGANVGNEIVA